MYPTPKELKERLETLERMISSLNQEREKLLSRLQMLEDERLIVRKILDYNRTYIEKKEN